MIDLKQISGLNLKLNEETNSLVFGAGMRRIVPDVRTLENMRGVLMDPGCEGPEKVYFMYRGISEIGGIRYDITVIPPGFLGREYVKTLGHYHPPSGLLELPLLQKARTPKPPAKKAEGPSYPEVYEVLHGQTLYILQKRKGGDDLELEDVVMVRAGPGQKVLIPPDYGHVTANLGKETLVMGNLVCSGFRSVYGPFLKAGGAGYYLLKGMKFEKNENYRRVPEIKEAKPLSIPILGLGERPLCLSFRRDPGIFKYLKDPGRCGKALLWF